MTSPADAVARKGRGATFDPPNRFSPTRHESVDDGWWQQAVPERLAAQVTEERSRSALAWNRSPDLPFDRSLNPYRGCEHGCIYCYARPSHAYWDLSPGLDFETRLIARSGLVERLEEELARPGYACRPINLAGNTDAYQPIEVDRRTTRALLTCLLDWRHPVTLITKSALILRDLDLLVALAERRLVQVMISLTSLDRTLKRRLEPRAAAPEARLEVIARLAGAGVPVGTLIAPLIPGLTDHELERLLGAARDAGAQEAGWMLLRLPREVAPLFEDWLARHYPERAGRVMSLIRQCRGGRDNDARFGHRLRGQGVFADLLAQRFRTTHRRLAFPGLPPLDTTAFRPPRRQGELFE